MSTRSIIISVLSDMDYNDGGMMRWSSGRPTAQAERVADRIVRELSKEDQDALGCTCGSEEGPQGKHRLSCEIWIEALRNGGDET